MSPHTTAASSPAPSVADNSKLLGQLGITRVARVTGLDRTGVEVACAVRPRGHVLQVCNGKGETFQDASLGAVLESAELWAAERVDPLCLRYGSVRDWQRCGIAAIAAEELAPPSRLGAPTTWLAWREAIELMSETSIMVPAHAAHCLPSGSIPLGPAVVPWTSNGMGAHPRFDEALTHALLEAIERDQLARCLPRGWSARAIRERLIERGSLRAAPQVRAMVESIEDRGFGVYLFDLTPPTGMGLPVGGALLVDLEQGPIPLTAGYACALRPEQALRSALLEAAQSRLTDVHGAREDVSLGQRGEFKGLLGLLRSVRASRPLRQMPRVKSGSEGRVKTLLRRMRRGGVRRVAAMELGSPEMGLSVVKVVVPGFELSGLL